MLVVEDKNKNKTLITSEYAFSERTRNYLSRCLKELSDSGIDVSKDLCFFYVDEGVWKLNYGEEYLGFLGSDSNDLLFKKLLNSIKNDYPCKFNLVIFPGYNCNLSYGGKFVVSCEKERLLEVKNFYSGV